MTNENLNNVFGELSTPLITDACIRNKFPLRVAPFGIKAVIPGWKIAGAVSCVKHFGSVDIFIESIHNSREGDVLIIDDSGRLDEGCIGDLTVLEAKMNGLRGIIVWGVHRDTSEIKYINFPVFSYGNFPLGPVRLDTRTENAKRKINFGKEIITDEDFVFADDDGVAFVHKQYLDQTLETAQQISKKEKRQANLLQQGTTLFKQLHFDQFLIQQQANPSLTFRDYLKEVGGAIEE